MTQAPKNTNFVIDRKALVKKQLEHFQSKYPNTSLKDIHAKTVKNIDPKFNPKINPKINTKIVKNSIVKPSTQSKETLVVNGISNCPNEIIITQADIPFIISQPGYYKVCGDLVFTPIDSFTSAITIVPQAGQNVLSDVTLDFNGYTLSQVDKTITDVYGVLVGEGYSSTNQNNVFHNITIKNGTVTRFSAIGVFSFNTQFGDLKNPPLDNPIPYTDLYFFNLNVLDCGPEEIPSFDAGSGISLDSFDFPRQIIRADSFVGFSNVRIENCNVNDCIGQAAIHISPSENVLVSDSRTNNLTCLVDVFSYTYSLDLFGGRNLKVINHQGNKATGVDPATVGSQVGGLSVNWTSNTYIEDSQFNQAFGESNVIVNSNVSINENFVAKDCQFNGNSGGPSVLFVAGVHGSDDPDLTERGDGYKFINCQFNGSRISSENPGGTARHHISGITLVTISDAIFENCEATNIVTDNPGFRAYGFELICDPSDVSFDFGSVHNMTLKNCTAAHIQSPRETIGVYFQGDSQNRTGNTSTYTNTIVQNCIVEKIQSTSSTEKVAGIAQTRFLLGTEEDTQPVIMKNLLVEACRISDVRAGPDNPLTASIFVESVINPVIKNNSISDCDGGVLLTGSNDIFPIGFTERGLIKENDVSNNLVFGYRDDREPCTSSAWLSNTAFCNGPNGKNNYQINWGGRPPVARGNLSFYPNPKNNIENIEITCGRCDCVSEGKHDRPGHRDKWS